MISDRYEAFNRESLKETKQLKYAIDKDETEKDLMVPGRREVNLNLHSYLELPKRQIT